MSRVRNPWSSLLMAAAVTLLAACRSSEPRPGRQGQTLAVRIARDSWRSPQELLALIDGAAETGFDTVLLEGRRDGTVVYASQYEPWAPALGGGDPGWDPLAVALERARSHGLRFLVAQQVVPVWSGRVAPAAPQHPWNVLRGWRWVDAQGHEQALREGALLSLDPCLPEVRGYLANVVLEPLRRYDLDGLVLDDVRYPNDYPSVPRGGLGDPPQGPRTRALYRAATGLAPEDDMLSWHRWRATQLTELVRAIRGGVASPGPRSRVVIAAVLPERAVAQAQHQDWRAWVALGLVDGVAPLDDGRRDPTTLHRRDVLWRERVAGGEVFWPLLAVDADSDTDGLGEAWQTRLSAIFEATGAVIVTGVEPWLGTGLSDLASRDEVSGRQVLAAAVGRL